ncbi:AAA family ATPase [Aliihoeflea sp. PC F10.4]
MTVIGPGKLDGWPKDIAEWFEQPTRIVAICHSTEEIPFQIRLAADAVLDLPTPTVRDVVGAWKMGQRGLLSELEATQLREVSFPILDAAARAGRSAAEVVSRVIEAAEDLSNADQAGTGKGGRSRSPTLDDLVGMGEADEWGRELAQDLRDWKNGTIPWSAVDRGILLSGPPGCGKTTFAKGLANTCGVELVTGSLAQWQAAGYLNALLKAMRTAFDEAKKNAPAILFIDEVDSFGNRAAFDNHNAQYCTEVVAGLLECLDGVEGREGVVVVGAANFPERLDPAITRAGRLDRHVKVSLPDRAARREILYRLLDHGIDAAALDEVAARLPGRSGADLEKLARDAKRRARRRGAPPSIADVEASMPPREAMPSEYRQRIALHEAGHAVVGRELGYGKIDQVVVPVYFDADIQSDGRVEFHFDQKECRTLSRVETEIKTLLAGAAAEALVLGGHSAGVGGQKGSDLHQATALAVAAHRSWGLGGRLTFMENASPNTGGLAYDQAARLWVSELLERCFEAAGAILAKRRRQLDRIAGELVEKGSLSGGEIDAILKREAADRRVRPRRRPVKVAA